MMSNNREQRVIIPVSNAPPVDVEPGVENDIGWQLDKPWYLRYPYISDFVIGVQSLSYERLKDLMRWFLDSASFDISVKVMTKFI